MPNGVGVLDVLLVVGFAAILPLWSHFVSWPKHVAAVDAGDPGARTRIYARTLIEEWAFALAAVALFVAGGRSLGALWLTAPTGWRAWVGFGLPAVYAALVVLQGRAIGGKPKTLARLRERMQPLRALIPHTPGELRWFLPLAVTAGICEEFLFRGYLIWVLAAWIGVLPGAIVSMVVFGLAHGYQGGTFGFRASLVGVFLGVMALVTRSLLPGILLHAAIDMGSGWITYLAMSRGGPSAIEPVKAPNGVAA
jgi:membrane protease YdiL (CAAX protease family)